MRKGPRHCSRSLATSSQSTEASNRLATCWAMLAKPPTRVEPSKLPIRTGRRHAPNSQPGREARCAAFGRTEANRDGETVSNVARAATRHRKVDRHAKTAIARPPRSVDEAVHPFPVLQEIELKPPLAIAGGPRDLLKGSVGVRGQAERDSGLGRHSGGRRLAIRPKETSEADRRQRERQRGRDAEEINPADATTDVDRVSGREPKSTKRPFVVVKRLLGARASIHKVEQGTRQPPLRESPEVGDRSATLQLLRKKHPSSHKRYRTRKA